MHIFDIFSGWFGLRKDFCPWLLGVCPVLQEYGNISYKIQGSGDQESSGTQGSETRKSASLYGHKYKGSPPDDLPRTAVPILSIEVPD